MNSTPPPPATLTPPAPTPTPTPTPTPPPPPPLTPPPTNYATAEYQNSTAAVVGQAIAAYDKGATGKGVKLAVIDSGINPSLSEFAGRIDPASRDVAGSRGLSDEDGHGTAVAATAAAAKDDVWMHGVAFDATVLAFRADSPDSCAKTGEDEGCKFGDNAIGAGIDAARLAGARVINMSLGGSPPGGALLSAMARATSAGIVLVISAGNDGGKPEGNTADAFASVPASQFPGMVIVAGSIGTFDREARVTVALDQLSPFSNKAGSASASYLAALGAGVKTIDHTGGRFFYSGTSFSAPAITGAFALMAQLFPNLSGRQIVDLLLRTADDLGAAGTDDVFGRGRMNLSRAVQPVGATSLAGSATPVTDSNGVMPAAGGSPAEKDPIGAIVLDGYSRAYAVDLAKTLRAAEQRTPLRHALEGDARVAGVSAGRVSVAMTVAERRDLRHGFALERTGIGPEDLRKAKLIAGSVVARIDHKTAVALGFSEGAKAMERRLNRTDSGAFLIARDVAGDPGFMARRGGSMAVRRDIGPVALTLSGEQGEVWQEVKTSATGSPYRWAAATLDRRFGRTSLSAGIGRLDERQTLLGGRMGGVFGGGGSATTFLDLEARRSFGAGFSAALTARRGWTTFAGGDFRTAAYGFDFARDGLFTASDRLGFRLSQPLRIDGGGLSLMLPTAYSYETLSPTLTRTDYALTPRGREIDAELGYSTAMLGTGWIGGNLFLRRQPGHVASADTDYGAAVRFTLGF
ncbi:S8 family peptidase [Sphingomonas sp. GCM10030256]|uniref:S8 family peptidase n=1 Tax=Sphingomonas sp. GCM10030256 TaxID=3273427 RepID=UPI003608A3B5